MLIWYYTLHNVLVIFYLMLTILPIHLRLELCYLPQALIVNFTLLCLIPETAHAAAKKHSIKGSSKLCYCSNIHSSLLHSLGVRLSPLATRPSNEGRKMHQWETNKYSFISFIIKLLAADSRKLGFCFKTSILLNHLTLFFCLVLCSFPHFFLGGGGGGGLKGGGKQGGKDTCCFEWNNRICHCQVAMVGFPTNRENHKDWRWLCHLQAGNPLSHHKQQATRKVKAIPHFHHKPKVTGQNKNQMARYL